MRIHRIGQKRTVCVRRFIVKVSTRLLTFYNLVLITILFHAWGRIGSKFENFWKLQSVWLCLVRRIPKHSTLFTDFTSLWFCSKSWRCKYSLKTNSNNYPILLWWLTTFTLVKQLGKLICQEILLKTTSRFCHQCVKTIT